MALYLGGNKVKIILDNIVYNMNIHSVLPTIDNEVLVASSDDYILQDVNGLYLAPKKEG